MSLPSIKNATFTIKVKEVNKPIKIRPMIVSEHKSIQQVTDIGSEADIALTIANVVKSCTNDIVNASNVPQYLLDFIFLQLYMSSVENEISTTYTCHKTLTNIEDGTPLIDQETGDVIQCNSSINVKIPLGMAKIIYPDNYDDIKTIKVNDETSLVLKALSLQSTLDILNNRESFVSMIQTLDQLLIEKDSKLESIEDKDSAEYKKIEKYYDDKHKKVEKDINKLRKEISESYLYNSVEYIETGDSIMKPETDFNKDEFIKWLDECPANVSILLDNFLINKPVIGMDLSLQCPKCGNKETTKLRGLSDFFS